MMTLEQIQKWTDQNPNFCQDQFNIDKLTEFHRQQGILNNAWLFDQFVKRNRSHFHWLESASIATPKNRDKWNALIDAGVQPSRIYGATERRLNEEKKAARLEEERKDVQKFMRKLEKRKAIEAANNIWIDLPYPTGPGGSRKDFRRSEEAKQKELARIAIEFKDVED